MKILIVDDEASARNLLKAMLVEIYKKKNKEVEMFEADCLEVAVQKIREISPEIVLLDIEMPGESGLHILDYFRPNEVFFNIIFVTAYNRYAIDAFKLNVVDYLLKPTDIQELEQAIDKVKTASYDLLQRKLDDLRNTFHALKKSKIALKVPTGLIFVQPKDIILMMAEGSYTKIYLTDGNKQVVARALNYFADQLVEYEFFYRPHRSYLINLNFMKEFSKKNGNIIILDNGISVPLSRGKKNEFTDIIEELFT